MSINQKFIDEYLDLLIIQYRDKEKAEAEIEMLASHFSRIFMFFQSFAEKFDLDNAVGDQLDILGKIVGVPRIVPFSLTKRYFGFSDNPDSLPFDEGTFFDLFLDDRYTDTELSDSQMRAFIRAKAAKNVTSPYMVSDDRISLQDVIQTAFSGRAYVLDNYDMTLTLYIESGFDLDLLRAIKEIGLLPSPQGVGYDAVISYDDTATFGFSDNPISKSFGDGVFANIEDI